MVVLGGWLAVDLAASRNHILADRAKSALQRSTLISQSFSSKLLATNYVLSDILDRVTVQDLTYPDEDLAHSRRMNALLKEKSDAVVSLAGITLYDSNCVLTARAVGTGLGVQLNSNLCTKLRAENSNQAQLLFVSAEDSPTGRAGLLLARNLPSQDGKFVGGVAAGLGYAFIQKWLSTFEVDEGDSLSLVDISRMMIARIPPLPELVGKRPTDSIFQPVFDGELPSASITAPSPRDGRVRIYGLTKAGSFPLYVIVGFDKVDALSEWQHRVRQIVAGYLVLFVLIMLLAHVHLKAVRQQQKMKTLAITDELTGIANRRQLISVGQKELQRSLRYHHPMSLLMIDIDHFKRVNDTWGHSAGDQILKSLSRVMVTTLRSHDVLGRVGGEEFAVILPQTNAAGARAVAELLRANIEQSETTIVERNAKVRCTVSIGVATLNGEGDSLDALMVRADNALYKAKYAGRDQIAVQ